MRFFRIALVVLLILVNLVVVSPSWADRLSNLTSNPICFEVGQKVVWLYRARADCGDVKKIPAEVVKLGPKRVQIKVQKSNSEFVNRWVNRDRLEVTKG
ncbi:MAG: hypothetical protein JO235_28350 [Chroococcidiopsidaceae cyanobacterium CP_BM_RX_35]|nr:hypothetical protein [Chroococcidiopsidaceae cyanobacterium CP_BM_RX_35]